MADSAWAIVGHKLRDGTLDPRLLARHVSEIGEPAAALETLKEAYEAFREQIIVTQVKIMGDCSSSDGKHCQHCFAAREGFCCVCGKAHP